jgi:hypothetical protein
VALGAMAIAGALSAKSISFWVAEDVNALAASINPVPMQILSFQHI